MTDIDLPLSDIITKKKIILNRGRAAPKTAMTSRQQTNSNVKPNIIKTTGDARNHLIQKKRQHFTDAREQLARIAKTSDARDKLNKIRGNQKGIPELIQELQAKPTDMRQKLNLKRNGALQVKKNFVNIQQVKTGLQTASKGGVGNTRMQGTAIIRTVSGNSGVNRTVVPTVGRTVQNLNRTVQNRGVSNASVNIQRKRLVPAKGISGSLIQQFHRSNAVRLQQQQQPAVAQVVTVRSNAAPLVRSVRPLQTVARRRVAVAGSGPVYATQPRHTMVAPQTIYRQVPARVPAYRQEAVVMQEQPMVYEQDDGAYDDEPLTYDDDYDVVPQQQLQPVYYEEAPVSPPYEPQYEEVYVPRAVTVQQQQPQHYGPPVPPQARASVPVNNSYVSRSQPRPQQQPARYTTQPQRYPQQQLQPQQQQQQRYSTQQRVVQQSPRRTAVARPAPPMVQKVVGHRVMVSNLHPVATNEDIKELFGNLGPISSCKMARPGTAVVVYLDLNDAKRSVDVYHNRKLDGQPMQVKIMGPVTEASTSATSSLARNPRTRMY
ncbi:mediator of RNA polymerase II transcription subunit 15 isoform X2 [Hyalella azteca]|uniref:Mediator of RNA polymerase II transcription subunit 15 isoform X2 n=1 Tax=Hyalella azteca TaxID=294128 RepID=A0A8B7PL69_HYAAZ|nr:mediator of RNA polymerase II transcription subunit 15 isoform X2 [Hyalella azteca]